MAEPIDMQLIVNYVRDNPQDILGWNTLYLALEAAGEVAKANQCRKTIATLYAQSKFTPESIETLKQMILESGDMWIKQGNYQQAVTDISRLLELDTQSAQAYQLRGVAYTHQQQYFQAIEDLTRAIALLPSDPQNYFHRGLTYYAQKLYKPALVDLNRAVDLKSDYTLAYYHRGRTYMAMSQFPQAITDFSRAIQLDTSYMPAYYSRGLVYFSKGDYLLAYKDFDRAHTLDPDDQDVVDYRSRTMQMIFQ